MSSLMIVVMAVMMALVVAGIVWGGWVAWRGRSRTAGDGGDARRILAERYARGEIDTEEYERRLRALEAQGSVRGGSGG